ncbi:ABC transporter substrate-binding protein [Streptomyces vietnamensis]|uniref:ABC transporter substrate-binding protein n=1 Tax=Streptomyces vietnamensis TaxID=362257 RepID=UPI0037AA0273
MNAKIGTALIGGYLLGRTKKGKLALSIAMAMAGSRIKPGQLGKSIAHSPFLSSVNQQVRGELVTAGKAAATTVLNAKAEHLADALHDRTEGMRSGKQDTDEEERPERAKDADDEPAESDEPSESADDEEGTDEASPADDESDAGDEEEEKPRARRTTSRSGSRSAPAAKKKAATTKRSTHRTSASGASRSTRSGSSGRRDDG